MMHPNSSFWFNLNPNQLKLMHWEDSFIHAEFYLFVNYFENIKDYFD